MWDLIKEIDRAESNYNGTVQVVFTIEGTRIKAGGLSQSGPLVEKVWDVALKRIVKEKAHTTKVLVLGLGGGSVAKLVNKYWPMAKIVGVEIDPIMIDFGRRYLRLNEIKNLTVVEQDAEKFIQKIKAESYQLILVDLYTGCVMPEQFTYRKFLTKVSSILDKDGVAIFNRLYSQSEEEGAHMLKNSLLKVFPYIKSVKPEANIFFICYP